jgi:hypothetical protein
MTIQGNSTSSDGLLEKSEEQIPRGLKPARNDKNKGLIGALRLRSPETRRVSRLVSDNADGRVETVLCSGQAKKLCHPESRSIHEFFSKL